MRTLSEDEYDGVIAKNVKAMVKPTAHVNLVLWLIHPRKGAGRGVEVKGIKKEDLPAIKAFLAEAARRNADRFKGVM